jgi:hypothetical protein
LFALDVHDLVLAKLVRNSPVDLEDPKIPVKAGQLDEDISKGGQENCGLISPTNPDMTLRCSSGSTSVLKDLMLLTIRAGKRNGLKK